MHLSKTGHEGSDALPGVSQGAFSTSFGLLAEVSSQLVNFNTCVYSHVDHA